MSDSDSTSSTSDTSTSDPFRWQVTRKDDSKEDEKSISNDGYAAHSDAYTTYSDTERSINVL